MDARQRLRRMARAQANGERQTQEAPDGQASPVAEGGPEPLRGNGLSGPRVLNYLFYTYARSGFQTRPLHVCPDPPPPPFSGSAGSPAPGGSFPLGNHSHARRRNRNTSPKGKTWAFLRAERGLTQTGTGGLPQTRTGARGERNGANLDPRKERTGKTLVKSRV
jgi:hypothetical protein